MSGPDALSQMIMQQRPELAGHVHYVNGRPWCDGVNHTTNCDPAYGRPVAAAASGLRFGGLDLSLTGTGVARIGDGELRTWTITPGKLRGWPRVELIISECKRLLFGCDVIACEGLAFGAKGNALLDLAALRGIMTLELHRDEYRLADVPPALLKQYATGKGNADKLAVYREALSRLPVSAAAPMTDDDQSDAAWLACMAADYYGSPLVRVPLTHRAALTRIAPKGRRKGLPMIDWPQLAAGAQAALELSS